MAGVFVVCIVIIGMSSPAALAQGGGAIEPRPPEWEGGSAGMELLYQMQNGFLNDLIQMKTIGNLIVQYNIDTFADLSSPEFVDQWSEWIIYGIGYMVCISIGLLLVIILPSTGCGICCARTCKCAACCDCCCCGGGASKPKHKDKIKKYKCKRIGFSTTLACLTAILLASVVCGFVACGQLKKQVEPYGFLETILQGLYTIDDYVESTSTELDSDLLVPIDDSIEQLNTTITYFPQLIVVDMGTSVGLLPDLVHFQQFANSLDDLFANLTVLNVGRAQLQTLAPALDAQLVEEHSNLSIALFPCLSYEPLCLDLYSRIPDLVVSTNYTTLYDMTAEVALIGGIITSTSLVADINNGANEFWNISSDINAILGSTLTDIQSSLGEFEQGVTDSIEEMQSALLSINLTDAQHAIWEAKPVFSEYGSYTYWGLVGILSICTLITFCYTVGLLFGLILPAPSEDSKSCSPRSHHGSSCLLAGVGLTLVFSWLLMLLTIILFATGGLVENNLCRHLVVYDESMDELERLVMNELDPDYNISMKEAMLSCQKNESLYIAASLEQNGVNITEVVDLSQYGIYDLLDYIRNVTIPFTPPTNIITPTINASMLLISGALDTIEPELANYSAELAKQITIEDLSLYISDLQRLETLVSDPSLVTGIRTEIIHLNLILNGAHQDVVDEVAHMQAALDAVNAIIPIFELPEGLGRLTDAEAELANNHTVVMKNAQAAMADDLEVLLEKLSSDIEDAVR